MSVVFIGLKHNQKIKFHMNDKVSCYLHKDQIRRDECLLEKDLDQKYKTTLLDLGRNKKIWLIVSCKRYQIMSFC